MKLLDQFNPPDAPMIDNRHAGEGEQEIAMSLQLNLYSLSYEARNLAAAVALFGFSREEGPGGLYSDWMRMAGRAGAMSIRNFSVALASVRDLVGRIDGWTELVDVAALKSAEKKLSERFPFAHKLRHSVAHPEFYNNPKKGMGADGPAFAPGVELHEGTKNNTVQDDIHGYTFSMTFDGELIHYDITPDTNLAVVQIVRDCFAAFEPVIWFRRD